VTCKDANPHPPLLPPSEEAVLQLSHGHKVSWFFWQRFLFTSERQCGMEV
jgi:hypothetical protein